MIAAVAYIPDSSLSKKNTQHWNNASKAYRERLLREAGRNPHYKFRAWAFVPSDVRIDVVTIIEKHERDQKASQASAANSDYAQVRG